MQLMCGLQDHQRGECLGKLQSRNDINVQDEWDKK